MDKSEIRETRDLTSVESFSQLPFIRRAPPVKDKSGCAIKLFGKELGGKKAAATADDDSYHSSHQGEANKGLVANDNVEMSSRKFECHYCCRNFPTSQALGGHQNAHKRERQQAKRVHLQSAMMHGNLSDPHVYSLMNYGCHGSSTSLPTAYHHLSWNTNSSPYNGNAGGRLYSTNSSYNVHHQHQHHPQPINGSPLTFWQIPTAQISSVFAQGQTLAPTQQQFPKFNSKDDFLKPLPAIRNSATSLSSQSQFGYESNTASMQDPVSLDLHL